MIIESHSVETSEDVNSHSTLMTSQFARVRETKKLDNRSRAIRSLNHKKQKNQSRAQRNSITQHRNNDIDHKRKIRTTINEREERED